MPSHTAVSPATLNFLEKSRREWAERERREEEMLETYSRNLVFMGLVKRMVQETLSTNEKTVGKPTEIEQGTNKSKNDPTLGTPTRSLKKNTMIKSPSDTTIYAPGLRQVSSNNNGNDNTNKEIIDRISDFVEEVRMETKRKENSGKPKSGTSTTADGSTKRAVDQPIEMDQDVVHQQTDDRGQHAWQEAERQILDAERFKAAITPTLGKFNSGLEHNERNVAADLGNLQINQLLGNNSSNVDVEFIKALVDNDDEFFHVTCHVEPSLRQKIEKGEFVDLEKLLPRERFPHKMSDDRRMEMVSRDGMTYFVPASDKDSRINGIRRWEQDFRIYAAIYCKEHPTRSAEIWQYVHVINTAAASFQWDNVAWYDYTFRQLMASKPHRTWAKLYTQFWNLAMQNPIVQTGNYAGNGGHNRYGQNSGNSSSGSRSGVKKYGDWRDNCCWIFNKHGKCSRQGCKFDNRCSYCGAWNHGLRTCRKVEGNRKPPQSGKK